MAVNAKDVMELRKATGLGAMECKQALEETNGDVSAAKDLLRKKGLAKMETRTDRTSGEGRIGAAVSADRSKGAVVEVRTETDFTANNDAFKAMVATVAQEALSQPAGDVTRTDPMQVAIDGVRLTTKENVQFGRGTVVGGPGSKVGSYVHFTGKIGVLVEVAGAEVSEELLSDLCMHVTAVSPTPLGIAESDIPADVIAKEKEIAMAQALESGKPAQIAEKMVTGKLRKFYEDHCLLLQPFVKDDKKRVKDLLPAGATIKTFVRYQIGG